MAALHRDGVRQFDFSITQLRLQAPVRRSAEGAGGIDRGVELARMAAGTARPRRARTLSPSQACLPRGPGARQAAVARRELASFEPLARPIMFPRRGTISRVSRLWVGSTRDFEHLADKTSSAPPAAIDFLVGGGEASSALSSCTRLGQYAVGTARGLAAKPADGGTDHADVAASRSGSAGARISSISTTTLINRSSAASIRGRWAGRPTRFGARSGPISSRC